MNSHVHLGDDVAKKLEEHGGERGQEGQDGDGGGGQAYVPVPSFPTCQTYLSSYLNFRF